MKKKELLKLIVDVDDNAEVLFTDDTAHLRNLEDEGREITKALAVNDGEAKYLVFLE